jgi:hypothetical protein
MGGTICGRRVEKKTQNRRGGKHESVIPVIISVPSPNFFLAVVCITITASFLSLTSLLSSTSHGP